MTKLPAEQIMPLLEAMQSFVGHEIVIREYISRERNSRGNDRHAATFSQFSFLADAFFGVSISGQLFGIESKGGRNLYCLSFRSVIGFEWEGNSLVITEHYEEDTARQTIIARAADQRE